MILDPAIYALLLGAGATAVMDAWMLFRTRVLGLPAQSYRLVGRWLAGLARGKFRHVSITASPAVRGELLIGWSAHYLIGVAFAAVLLAIWGLDWARRPTLAPALVVGIATVLAPFLVMQPGMGAGFFASRTPKPGAARLQSVITHTIFGVGLYAAGRMVGRLTA